MRDWDNDKIDGAYLLDSGILFEINRGFLHLFGISLVVNKNPETGESTLAFLDNRKNPADCIFKKEIFERGDRKLRNFMKQFGYKQMKKRNASLGYSSQSWFVPEKKRYKNE